MARVVMQAVVSVDGYIAYPDDTAGPLFDWYGNGDSPAPRALISYDVRARQRVGCSPAGVAVKPAPIRREPDAASAVIAWVPRPDRPKPAGSYGSQVTPFRDVQTATR